MIGIQGLEAVTWDVYSESVKRGQKIDEASPYRLYEVIVDAVRPKIKQGVKTILVASTDEKDYASFMSHIERHQSWLLKGWELNKATFEHLPMAAMDERQVREILKTNGFKKRLSEASSVDMKHVMEVLEERLNDPDGIETLLFSLDEIESHIYGGGEAACMLVTDQFHERHRRRAHRLLQVAANRSTQTSIVSTDTAAGARLTQFGGLVCLIKTP
jgi:stalled ribosome rescue protein Dom34